MLRANLQNKKTAGVLTLRLILGWLKINGRKIFWETHISTTFKIIYLHYLCIPILPAVVFVEARLVQSNECPQLVVPWPLSQRYVGF